MFRKALVLLVATVAFDSRRRGLLRAVGSALVAFMEVVSTVASQEVAGTAVVGTAEAGAVDLALLSLAD